jgi:hypothetical protein
MKNRIFSLIVDLVVLTVNGISDLAHYMPGVVTLQKIIF